MHDHSIHHLRTIDPVLATVIDRVGPCRLEPRSEGTHFDALVRSIVYQQLSGKAASTILSRVHALYGNRSPLPAPRPPRARGRAGRGGGRRGRRAARATKQKKKNPFL